MLGKEENFAIAGAGEIEDLDLPGCFASVPVKVLLLTDNENPHTVTGRSRWRYGSQLFLSSMANESVCASIGGGGRSW